MSLMFGSDLTFFSPALPEAFVPHELESALGKALSLAKESESAPNVVPKALQNEPLTTRGAQMSLSKLWEVDLPEDSLEVVGLQEKFLSLSTKEGLSEARRALGEL